MTSPAPAPDKARAREIREQLSALAPWPESGPVTATVLAAHFAANAQERWIRLMDSSGMGSERFMAQIVPMGAEFAAAVALAALADPGPHLVTGGPRSGLFDRLEPGESLPDMAATLIREAMEDGGDLTGELLWQILGDETAGKIAGLARELEAAIPAPVSYRDRALALADAWDAEAEQMRAEFAGDSNALAALASGHKEANLLRDRAAALRAAMADPPAATAPASDTNVLTAP